MHELLNARRVLRASYPYGYYLTGNKDKKAIFESMQVSVGTCLRYYDICTRTFCMTSISLAEAS